MFDSELFLFEKAMRDVQAARAEVRKEAERADALEDQGELRKKKLFLLLECLKNLCVLQCSPSIRN